MPKWRPKLNVQGLLKIKARKLRTMMDFFTYIHLTNFHVIYYLFVFCRFASEISDTSVRRKPAMSRLKQQQQKLAYDNLNFSDMPPTTSQNKMIRNSIEILQQKQDEIFEL